MNCSICGFKIENNDALWVDADGVERCSKCQHIQDAKDFM